MSHIAPPRRRDTQPDPTPAAPEVRMVAVDDIRTDGDTQCREEMDPDTLDDYAARMEAGDQFPPLEVCEDSEGNLWLWDGHHRLRALLRLGWEAVKVRVSTGTLDDARRLAVGANAGPRALPRSNKDKRHAVTLALGWWPDLTDRALAEIAAVSNNFVGCVRREVSSDDTSKVSSLTRTGKDGKQYPAPAPVAEPPRLIDRPDIVDGPDDPDEDPWADAPEGRTKGPSILNDPAKPQPKPAKAPTVDELGIPIQPHAIAAFAEVPKFKALVAKLKECERDYGELVDGPAGVHLGVGAQWVRTGKDADGKELGKWVMSHISNAVSVIDAARPAVTDCPYAHNEYREHGDECAFCRNARWTGRLSKDRVPAAMMDRMKSHYAGGDES